jgi:ABC-type branched-subunit amino acid transport system ATPase component
VKTIFHKIAEINQTPGITILLVEQNANLALDSLKLPGMSWKQGVILEDKCGVLR